MAKLILGLAGEIASGKGTVAKYIVDKYEADFFRFSDMLTDVLNRLFLEQKRENFTKLSVALRQAFGQDMLANVMREDAEHSKKEIVVIDGARRLDDIRYLRGLPHFKFIYIDASMETRYERIIKRGEHSDDKQKTFEEFKKDHQLETELQIKDLKNHADFVIDNDEGPEKMYAQVDSIIKSLL